MYLASRKERVCDLWTRLRLHQQTRMIPPSVMFSFLFFYNQVLLLYTDLSSGLR